MVEIDLVSFKITLGLIVCNLRGEEAPDKYKGPPPPLIHIIISFSQFSSAATMPKSC